MQLSKLTRAVQFVGPERTFQENRYSEKTADCVRLWLRVPDKP